MARVSLSSLSVATHVLALFWLGLMAGFFATYSANVNLATAQFDGQTYATVQSALNRNVRHPLFFIFFFLPPGWCILTLAAGWRQRGAWRWWLLAAALLYGGVIFFTRQVNLPLNAYTESWLPGTVPADWSATRDAWNEANLWRSIASAFALGFALVSLSLRGRGPKQA